MTLFDALKNKTVARAQVAGESYSVTRVQVAQEGAYDGKVAGFSLHCGIAPFGQYTSTDDIEEAVRDTRGSYSQWRYADWR